MSTRVEQLAQRRADAARRQRQSRQRRRNGFMTALVDVRQDLASELVKRGLLAAEDAADPYLIGDAIGLFLDHFLCEG